MIAWFKKLFYIPKYGKVEECTMTARAVLTLCTVIAGLAAMGFSAYAYFSSTVSSGFTNITAATFQTVLSVQLDDENGAPVELHPGAEQTKWVELSKDQTYYIHIQRTPESTANTGFVIVTVGGGMTYHTQQLGKDGDINRDAIAFLIRPAADIKLLFRDNWGTSSYYSDYRDFGDVMEQYITDGETIVPTLQMLQTPPPEDEPENTDPTEETTPETEVTDPTEETAPATEETESTEVTTPETEETQPAETVAES